MTASAKIVTKESIDQLIIPNGALRFKPKTQNQEKRNTMNLVQGPKRPQGENKAKDLSRKDMSPIFVLENNEVKRIMVKVLDTDGKSSTVESKDLKVDDEVIISQKSDDAK